MENQLQDLIDKQQNEDKENEKKVEDCNHREKLIGDKYVKFPFDFVMAKRVESFHRLMREFVDALKQKLDKLEEFELDMRNWNGLFHMRDLKKELDKAFAQDGVMKLTTSAVQRLVSRVQQSAINSEEVKAGIRCSFLMD